MTTYQTSFSLAQIFLWFYSRKKLENLKKTCPSGWVTTNHLTCWHRWSNPGCSCGRSQHSPLHHEYESFAKSIWSEIYCCDTFTLCAYIVRFKELCSCQCNVDTSILAYQQVKMFTFQIHWNIPAPWSACLLWFTPLTPLTFSSTEPMRNLVSTMNSIKYKWLVLYFKILPY